MVTQTSPLGPRFFVLTLMWLALTWSHFASVQETSKRQGVPLKDVDRRIYDKIILTLQSPWARNLVPMLTRGVDLTAPYERRLSANPSDAALRYRYAIVLMAVQRKEEARRQLNRLIKEERSAQLSSALRDAFHLEDGQKGDGTSGVPIDLRPPSEWPTPDSESPQGQAHGGEPHGISSADVARDEGLLRARVDGWPLKLALRAVYERGGLLQEARHARRELESQASRTALGLCLIGCALAGSFVLGIVVLVVYFAAAPSWNLRPQTETPAVSAIAGWSLVVAWQLVSLAVQMAVLVASRGTWHPSILGILGIQLVIYAVTALLIHRVIGGRWERLGLNRRNWAACGALGLAMFWAAFVFIVITALLMVRVSGQDPSKNTVFQLIADNTTTPLQIVTLLLFVCFLGPLFEEILFRGVLYTAMRQVMRARWAIPLSAFVFAAVHGDLGALMPLTVLACVLAWGFERTGSLIPSTVTHCLWNTQVFLIVVFLFL